MRLFGLYLVVEFAALVALAWRWGLGWTLLLLLVGAVLGGWLVSRQGARAALAAGEAMRGRRPADGLGDRAMLGLAGLLILVPGVLSDLVGLALLVPAVRGRARRRLARAAERRVPGLRAARIRNGGPVIDGEIDDPPYGAAGVPTTGDRGDVGAVPGPVPRQRRQGPLVIEGRTVEE